MRINQILVSCLILLQTRPRSIAIDWRVCSEANACTDYFGVLSIYRIIGGYSVNPPNFSSVNDFAERATQLVDAF
jgi:hypothetical protein